MNILYLKRHISTRKFILLAFILFAMALGTLSAESDNGKFLPSKEKFSVGNIYLSLEPAKLQFPFLFLSTKKDFSATMTPIGYAFAGEIGYNWSGWLLGVYSGYSRYGQGKGKYSLMNNFQNLMIGANLSRVITNKTIKSMPKWLELAPTFGMGVDLIKTNYYMSHKAKDENKSTDVKFGDKGAIVAYYHIAFQTAFNLGTDYAIPYINLECNIFSDKIGTAFFPGMGIGVRMYPFTGLAKKKQTNENKDLLGLKMVSKEFTPDGDGKNDEAVFKIDIDAISESAKSWKMNIFDSKGKLFKTISGEGVPPNKIVWDGFGKDSTPAEIGTTYKSNLEVLLSNNKTISSATNIPTGLNLIKSTGREYISLKMGSKKFTPDGDGKYDNAELKIKSKRLSEMAKSWKINILDDNDEIFKTFEGKGEPPKKIIWNGLGEKGNTVKPNSIYKAQIEVLLMDSKTISSATNIKTANFESKSGINLTMETTNFTPDSDGKNDKAVFKVEKQDLADMPVSWKLLILDPDGDPIKTITGQGEPPTQITWNGLDENGKAPISDSVYKANMIVALKNGKKVSSSSDIKIGKLIKKEVGPPAVKFGKAPEKFSPDGDGINDEAIFRFANNNLNKTAKDWNFTVHDPKGNLFKKMSGSGAPPEKIKWDGKGDSGEYVLSAVPYKTTMEILLKNGKKLKSTSTLKTGIIIERQNDGTRRIRLSTLFFDPNAATFNRLSARQKQSNKEGLDAVAETIKNYPEYNIIVEGHANNISGTEKENIEALIPLSQKRADAIAKELNTRGVQENRISTLGMGGSVPVVSREKKSEWWKNRRVEFILKKK